MKKLYIFFAVIITTSLLMGAVFATPAFANGAGVIEESCRGSGSISALCDDGGQSLLGEGSVFQNITNAFLYVIGAIAVIMIIVGGFRYTISNGDQSAITSAKNTILYSVVGLIIAISAFAIVNFVLNNV